MGILEGFGIYLLLGIVALGLLDLFTGRIRRKLKLASYQTQEKLALSGSFVGSKTAIMLTLIALWLFYPVAIYGAISSLVIKGGNKKDGA
jgi:hypothetical protein